MRPIHEHVISSAEESLSCLRFSGPAFDCPYHTHPEIEILHIEESEGQCLIGDALDVFRRGDCFLFGPNLPHMFLNSLGDTGQASSRFIQFSPACFGEAFFDLPEFQKVASLLRQSRAGLRFAPSVLPSIHSAITAVFSASGALKIAAFVALLATLTEAPATALTMAPQRFPETTLDSERISRVLAHIHANFRQELRLREVACVSQLSPSAFERLFLRHVRRTFSSYLTEVRLSESRRLLIGSDKTVAEIAFESGFNNLSNFNRHFKRRQEISPTQFRTNARATKGRFSGLSAP